MEANLAAEKNKVISLRNFSVSPLYHFIYCMLLHETVTGNPFMGGVLFLLSTLLIRARRLRQSLAEISKKEDRHSFLTVWSALVLGLLAILRMNSLKSVWPMLPFSFLLCLRQYRIISARNDPEAPSRSFAHPHPVWCILPVFFLLLIDLKERLLYCIVGYLIGVLLDINESRRTGERIPALADVQAPAGPALSQNAPACRAFSRLAAVASAALPLILAAGIHFDTKSVSPLSVLVFVLFLYLSVSAAESFLSRSDKTRHDPGNLLLLGFLTALAGLLLCSVSIPPAVSTLPMILCASGAAFSTRALERLETVHSEAVLFACTQTKDSRQPASAADASLSVLTGCSIALTLLSLASLILYGRMRQGLSAVPLNSLLFLLPAILFVLLSIVFTLRYPLTLRRICKLERYLTLRQKGEENKPLRRQLESFILQKSYREFLYRVLIFVLRLLFPHRLCGRENLHFDPDIPCVFVCNHGEVYGPLITNIHIPYPFRTWTTSEMMEEKTISNYMKASSFVAGFPLPRRMKIWLIDHIFTQFDAWVMRVIEAIPVYHGSTRGLMNTFRATTDAMEAGDNILIFPEDSSTSESGVYAQEGVSDFFTGFVTIAQLFRSRTGKCCQFIPVYADKQRKRITFGTSVRYDPDAVGAEEKERICTALKNEINRIAFSPDPPKRRVFGKS